MEIVKRLGEGGMNKQSTRDFQGSENTLYNTVMVYACYYTFVKTPIMNKE